MKRGWKVKSFDSCRIWTYAGNPNRFLVYRLNHSAKLSLFLTTPSCKLKQNGNLRWWYNVFFANSNCQLPLDTHLPLDPPLKHWKPTRGTFDRLSPLSIHSTINQLRCLKGPTHAVMKVFMTAREKFSRFLLQYNSINGWAECYFRRNDAIMIVRDQESTRVGHVRSDSRFVFS